MPVHVRVIEWRLGCERICVIQPKRHSNRKPQAAVFPHNRNAENMIRHLCCTVLARARPVLQVNEGHGIVLPCPFRGKSHVMAGAARIDELNVTHVETQV